MSETRPLHVRMTDSQLARLDEWRRRIDNTPTRSKAARLLIEGALNAASAEDRSNLRSDANNGGECRSIA
jgi:hypothetical protein